MLLSINHTTQYNYSSPVFIEPMSVRLKPRSDARQTVHSHKISVTPTPSGISPCIEIEGNHTETLWFSGLHTELKIEVHSIVETHYGSPFNFLITDSNCLNLPPQYEPQLNLVLSPYLLREENNPAVNQLSKRIMASSNNETIPFLTALAAEIPKRIQYMLREHGDPWKPGETLKNEEGSCRDFAMLFIDACRSTGIAARFVSGYCYGDVAANSHMHAWAEVYLPGAGWRGFDPSRGAPTSDEYISVAAAQRSQDAAPTSGNFRGTAAESMGAQISITIYDQKTKPI